MLLLLMLVSRMSTPHVATPRGANPQSWVAWQLSTDPLPHYHYIVPKFSNTDFIHCDILIYLKSLIYLECIQLSQKPYSCSFGLVCSCNLSCFYTTQMATATMVVQPALDVVPADNKGKQARKERKRVTDRVAQREHRRRQKVYVEELEAEIRLLKDQTMNDRSGSVLIQENERLRKEVNLGSKYVAALGKSLISLLS